MPTQWALYLNFRTTLMDAEMNQAIAPTTPTSGDRFLPSNPLAGQSIWASRNTRTSVRSILQTLINRAFGWVSAGLIGFTDQKLPPSIMRVSLL
ncbi:MAG: hypothetical protein F6K30_23730 [Cyanothece sp. SIO2G6]|nr:hypothetical protein [Cyanothece sp. SIO2G6]